MKFYIFVILIVFAFQIQLHATDLKLWFEQPAQDWNEALPVGNGRLGAMVFGGAEKERLQLNEETVWTGSPIERHNPHAREALPLVRELLFQGQYVEAEKMAQEKIMGKRLERGEHTYQTCGNLFLEVKTDGDITGYRRELDLQTAIARVEYRDAGNFYTREVFCSAPHQVMAVRLTTDKRQGLAFNLRLSRPGDRAKVMVENNKILMTEHVGNGNGVRMAVRLRVKTRGKVTAHKDHIRVSDAASAVILLTAATDYRGQDPERLTRTRMDFAAKKPYQTLLQAHLDDYQQLFGRVSLNLGTTGDVSLPTDERLKTLGNGYADPQLFALYFQFGRYLLISSSRDGSLPANLQGIWAEGLQPPWNADYHININIQMNYWPAEITNLSECHGPFLEFIRDLVPSGRETAHQTYGCRGAAAHHTTDVWHFTAPIGRTGYGLWPMGLAWCCRHLWEHYLFTMDEIYLRDFAWPVMKEAALFVIDYLAPHPREDYWVSGPSISPENRFQTKEGETATVVMGPTMDHMIIYDLLQNCLATLDILGAEPEFGATCSNTLAKLAPLQIGSDGRIMEWTEEFREPEPGHRHMSHLYGLHPGEQITMQKNPEFLRAARQTIDYRLAHGGGHTGWSRAWIINFFARLRDGNKAYENLVALLQKSTLPNLFDNHPPFQIDGNFGATAGMVEMLLQSHGGEIVLLPALPDDWDSGAVSGICARGGFVFDLAWDKGRLNSAKLFSRYGGDCTVRYDEKVAQVQTRQAEIVDVMEAF